LDSSIAAWSLGPTALGAVGTATPGVPYGVTAHQCTLLTYKTGSKVMRYTWPSSMDNPTRDGDFVMRMA
jgi:hypothetical protein